VYECKKQSARIELLFIMQPSQGITHPRSVERQTNYQKAKKGIKCTENVYEVCVYKESDH